MDKIKKAKNILKINGFYIDNLWCVNDVGSKFNCTNDEAQEILNLSLTNEATMEQIWFSINEFGTLKNLEKIK